MTYDVIVIDSANLFYKLKKSLRTSLEIIKKIINYIEGDIKGHLKEEGEIYILFDPISYSDLGESKNFYFSLNERKKILTDYKANRTYSPLYLETIELLRKYYLYRGDKIKLIYSDEHEADDYIEPLLEQFKDKKIALISNDLDFARYINFNVHMINEGFDKIFTKEQFEKLFQFSPTIAANTMYKALLGDQSDNIVGACFMKKVKFNTNIKILCRNYLQELSKSEITLNEAIQQFKTANFQQLNKKTDKTAFDILYLTLAIVDLKTPILEKLYTNIRVIRSSLSEKNLEPYIHSNPENKTINDMIHKSIYGIPFKQFFGKS